MYLWAHAGEAGLRGCDASIKRNTALIKKLRSLTADNEAAVLKDCAAVNQEKAGHNGLFFCVYAQRSTIMAIIACAAFVL
jgi:hypothetical protein